MTLRHLSKFALFTALTFTLINGEATAADAFESATDGRNEGQHAAVSIQFAEVTRHHTPHAKWVQQFLRLAQGAGPRAATRWPTSSGSGSRGQRQTEFL